MIFEESRTGLSQKDNMTDDTEARNDHWSIAGNYICRHHVEPRVKLWVPEEELFPMPLRYIDVVRRIDSISDVLLESRKDDYWNVDGGPNLSEPWTGFHAVHKTE